MKLVASRCFRIDDASTTNVMTQGKRMKLKLFDRFLTADGHDRIDNSRGHE